MRPLIFTDLDGTLLDYSNYSFEKALPALEFLKNKDIPLIICSSKTKKEIEHYREKLGNIHPFISENGGGIFIPGDYFGFEISDIGFITEEIENYLLIRLGAKYADLREAIIELNRTGFPVKGFGDMTVEEISGITNLSIHEASMAKERDFDEPFIFNGDEAETQRLIAAVETRGFNVTQGRFFHILGNSNKGKAVSILIEIYKKYYGKVVSIAIGDSPNDIPMLERVDYPVIVRKPDGSYDRRIKLANLIRAEGIGPEGWNNVILKLLPASRLLEQ